MVVHDGTSLAVWELWGSRSRRVGSGGGVRGRRVVDWNILRLWEWGCDCGSRAKGCVGDADIPALVDEMAD